MIVYLGSRDESQSSQLFFHTLNLTGDLYIHWSLSYVGQ